MSVAIEPTDLSFRRPFTVEVAETLRIKNPNNTAVAFKVKTTAPKQYCVRPNSGRIEANRSVEVTVLLQAMKQDPAHDYKCRDKFLVQSVPISADKEFIPITDIWDHVEKPSIMEKKIRVNFLPAEEDPDALTPARPTVANGYENTPDVPPPAYASPESSRGLNGTSSVLDTPSDVKHDLSSRSLGPDSLVPAPLTTSGASPVYSGSPNDVSSTSHSGSLGTIGAAGTAAAVGAAATAAGLAGASHAVSTNSTTSRDLASEAAPVGADAGIDGLSSKLTETETGASLQDGGLRQRNVTGSDGATDSTAVASVTSEKGTELAQATRQGTEGVPVQVAALLCFLCFLLAYFFF